MNSSVEPYVQSFRRGVILSPTLHHTPCSPPLVLILKRAVRFSPRLRYSVFDACGKLWEEDHDSGSPNSPWNWFVSRDAPASLPRLWVLRWIGRSAVLVPWAGHTHLNYGSPSAIIRWPPHGKSSSWWCCVFLASCSVIIIFLLNILLVYLNN